MVSFKVVSRHTPGQTEKYQENDAIRGGNPADIRNCYNLNTFRSLERFCYIISEPVFVDLSTENLGVLRITYIFHTCH